MTDINSDRQLRNICVVSGPSRSEWRTCNVKITKDKVVSGLLGGAH